jgi:hypothetical protein
MTDAFPRKLYGRRKGPKLSAHKEDLRRTLLPRVALKIDPGADPRTYFVPPPCLSRRSSEGAKPDGEVDARSASGGGSLATRTAPKTTEMLSVDAKCIFKL